MTDGNQQHFQQHLVGAMALAAQAEIPHMGGRQKQAAEGIEPCTCMHWDRFIRQIAGARFAARRVRDRFRINRVVHALLNKCKN